MFLYETDQQKDIVLNQIKDMESKTKKKVMTEVKELKDFYLAETYHQKFLTKGFLQSKIEFTIMDTLSFIAK